MVEKSSLVAIMLQLYNIVFPTCQSHPSMARFITTALLMLFFTVTFPSYLTQPIPIFDIQVVKEFPHDRNASTQGLLYTQNDTFYESTGINRPSSVRRIAPGTAKIHEMEHKYFGQGLTLFGEKLLQVTWKTTGGFIYDKDTLNQVGTFSHQMKEGWGLATDGKVIFGSDGSSTLYHIDPHTFEVIEEHVVNYNGTIVKNLCELEYVNGEVWATIWKTDCIARISSKNGSMLGWIFLPSLRAQFTTSADRRAYTLNGIAWDKEQNRVFVTGMSWATLFEIKVVPMKKTFNRDIEKLCTP